MRDGLQLEAPVPLDGQAGDARGPRRHRRAADRGDVLRLARRPCPPSPTPTRSPPSCPAGATCTGRRWSPTRAGRCGRSTPASPTWSTWCRPPTRTAGRTPAGPRPRPSAAVPRDRRPGPRRRRLARGHHRHGLGLPVRRAHPDRPHGRRRPRRRDRRRRPAVPRRHDRDDDAAARGPAARRRPPRLPGRARRRALPRHPRHRAGQRAGRRPGRGDPAGLLDRRARRLPVRARAPAATSPPRSWSTCWRSPACATGLDLDAAARRRRGSPSRPSGHELPSSLYRAGGRSVPRARAADRTRRRPTDGPPGSSTRRVDAGGARPLRLRGHRRHRGHRRRADRVHLPVVQLAVPRPAAGRLRARPGRRRTWPRLREIGRFCVNVLAEGQDDVSQNVRPVGRRQVRRRAWTPSAHGRRCSTTSSPGSTASCGPSTTAATTRSSWPACWTSAPIPTAVRCCSTAAPTGCSAPRRGLSPPRRVSRSGRRSARRRPGGRARPLTAASHSSRGPAPAGAAASRSHSAAMPWSMSCPGRSISPSV